MQPARRFGYTPTVCRGPTVARLLPGRLEKRMSGRRENISKDRRRNSVARKRTHKEGIERQKQQAGVLRKLVAQAKAVEKAA